MFQYLKKGTLYHPVIPLSKCTISPDSLLLVNKLIHVLDKPKLFLRILKSCHEYLAAGHPGHVAMYKIISKDYWWPKMC